MPFDIMSYCFELDKMFISVLSGFTGLLFVFNFHVGNNSTSMI